MTARQYQTSLPMAAGSGPAQAQPSGAEHFAALAGNVWSIGPSEPRQRLALPTNEQSYIFTMDNDLVKLVTLLPTGDGLRVRVRYATDAVLDEGWHSVDTQGEPEISADGLGLVISWQTPLLPGFNWLMIRRKRRF